MTRSKQNDLKKVETPRPVETRSIDAMANDLVKIETLNMSGELEGGSLEILRHGAGGGDVTAKLHKCKD